MIGERSSFPLLLSGIMRFSLRAERFERFLAVLRRNGDFVGFVLDVHAGLQVRVEPSIDGELSLIDGDRGRLQQLRRQLRDGRAELRLVVGNAVEQAELVGLLRRNAPRGQDELLRARGPDEPRQPLRAAAAGDDAEADLGQAELHPARGVAEVAGERELEPAAEGEPAERGDRRLRQLLQRGEHRFDAMDALPDVLRRAHRLALLQISAGTERAASAFDDDDARIARAASDLFDERAKRIQHRPIDRVQLLRPVQPDITDMAAMLKYDRLLILILLLRHPLSLLLVRPDRPGASAR